MQRCSKLTLQQCTECLALGTEVWPRGCNAHLHSHCFAIFLGSARILCKCLLILKAEATTLFFILLWREKIFVYQICLQYSLYVQMQFHFFGRSLKFTTKRIRLQYLIFYSTIAWGEIKELAFWDTQGLDEKLRPLAVNSPLHQHCFSIIVKVQPLISFLPQPCPEESRQTDQSFLVSRLLWKDRRFSSQTNLQDQF